LLNQKKASLYQMLWKEGEREREYNTLAAAATAAAAVILGCLLLLTLTCRQAHPWS